MSTLSAAITLFLVLDPLGNIPFFLSALKPVEEARRPKVILRELLIAYVALVFFLFLGRPFVALLHLRSESITIAGGIILFIISIRMIFPATKNPGVEDVEGEPLLVPLAIPGVAGPSAMATVLLLVGNAPDRILEWFAAVTAAWLAAGAIILASPLLFRVLRKRGLIAMERLMGMILVALSVQMFLDGLAL
jgi:MarC family membrane protein